MSAVTQTQALSLELVRHLKSDREKVFAAWTDPEQLRQWFGPSEKYEVRLAEVELRAGGRYRLALRSPDGADVAVSGEYKEIVPGEKLVFTWRWDHSDEAFPDTLVCVELRDHDGGTEMHLTHSLFSEEKQVEMHTQGWIGCLERLVTRFA